jgi:hypothetical protein
MKPEWGMAFGLGLRPAIVRTPVIYLATMSLRAGDPHRVDNHQVCRVNYRKSNLQAILSEQFVYPSLQDCMPSFAPRENVPKLGVRLPLF